MIRKVIANLNRFVIYNMFFFLNKLPRMTNLPMSFIDSRNPTKMYG